MKKIIIYILLLILISFLIPILFTKRFNETKEIIAQSEINNSDSQNKEDDYSNKDDNVNSKYGKYKKVKLLHSKTNEVEEIDLNEYLYGVVSAEMPASFENEALKAQSIVARTYTLYKIINNGGKHEGADICDSSNCCQAWISKEDRFNKWDESERESNWNKITKSVDDTSEKIITYNGEPINAFFHSNSGGTTETPLNVWGGSGYPYLQSVETSGEDAYSQYESEVTITKDELINKMKEYYEDFSIDFEEEEPIKAEEYTEGGRVKSIKLGNKTLSGVEVRTIFSLKSANFNIEINEEDIKFSVKGYGHGVGMSQTGADSLAKQGITHEEIIKHFYTGVEIISISSV